jgi:hypothetical protein
MPSLTTSATPATTESTSLHSHAEAFQARHLFRTTLGKTTFIWLKPVLGVMQLHQELCQQSSAKDHRQSEKGFQGSSFPGSFAKFILIIYGLLKTTRGQHFSLKISAGTRPPQHSFM